MYYILQPLSNHIFVKPIERNQRRLSAIPACRQAGAGVLGVALFLSLTSKVNNQVYRPIFLLIILKLAQCPMNVIHRRNELESTLDIESTLDLTPSHPSQRKCFLY